MTTEPDEVPPPSGLEPELGAELEPAVAGVDVLEELPLEQAVTAAMPTTARAAIPLLAEILIVIWTSLHRSYQWRVQPATFQAARTFASTAEPATPRMGCKSIAGAYLLAGTSRPRASAMVRTWCGAPPRPTLMYFTPRWRAAPANAGMSNRVHENGSSASGNTWSTPSARSDSIVGIAGLVRYGTGCAATAQSTALRLRSSSGSMVAGPRSQFSPTTGAP